MKKTLIITLEYPPEIGGIATYIDQLAQSLPPEDVLLLTVPHKEAADFDANRAFRIVRHAFYYPVCIWPRWLRLYFQVKKLVKEYGIEMIHVHHILPVGTVARMIKKKLGVPYLIFSHGTDIVTAGKQKRKRALALKVARESEQVVTNSKNLQERLLKHFPELEGHCTVLYPCPDAAFSERVDPDVINQMRSKYALEGKQVMLSVARLIPSKGFRHLIRLLPAILQRVPHLVWFIIGDGQDKDEIIKLIRKHNLQNIVRFIGEIPHAQMRDYYHIADLFVLLTHPYQGLEEGLGLVFLEAAAAGLPVVAGKSGGVQEAVLHGETGWVLDVEGEAEQIIEAIVRLLQHPDEAKLLAEAAQKRIQSEFVWEKQLQAIKQWL